MSNEPRIGWLRQQIDEDEAAAKATAPSGTRWSWRTDVMTDDYGSDMGSCVISDPDVAGVAEALGLERDTGQQVAEHIARHDPARVLREVEAKRKILELHYALEGNPALCVVCLETAPCDTVTILASVYSDARHWGSND